MRHLILLSLITVLLGLPAASFAQTDDGYLVLYVNDAGEVIGLNPQTGEQRFLLAIPDPLRRAISLYPAPDGSAVAVFVRLTDATTSPPTLEYHLYVIGLLLANSSLLLDHNLLPPDYRYPVPETLGDPNYELTRALGEVVWSPNSRYMAFISGQAGSADVFLYEPATAALTHLNDAPQTAAFIQWNPTSDALIFSELTSFGDGSGYQGAAYYAAALPSGELRPIPLPEPANQNGIAFLGWRDAVTLLYSPLNFDVYGAKGIFALNLGDLTSTELLPAHIALNVPVFDPTTGALAFVVPTIGELNLAPGAYLWLPSAATPTFVHSGTFYTVERVRAGVFQFESPEGSYLVEAAFEPTVIPLPQHDYGAFVAPVADVDALVLARADGTYISRLSVDDATLVWPEQPQVPIWSPDGTKFYTFGFTDEGAGLVEVDVVTRSLRLLDSRMAVNSPRAIAP